MTHRVISTGPREGVVTLFRNRYRVESTRVPVWDYSQPAWYFVTICTRNRVCTLGEVVNNEIILSPSGQIVKDEWKATAEIRPNVDLDASIIMPNHLHGIIVIEPVETTRRVVSGPTTCNEGPEIVGQGKLPGGQRRRPNGSSLQGGSL